MKNAGRWIALLGFALAAYLFARDGIEPIGPLLASAGWGLVLAALFHLLPMMANARAWQALLMPSARMNLPTLTAAIWIRESVNGLLPVARIGGEVAGFRVLTRLGAAKVPVAASLLVDVAISLLSQVAFCVAGVALLLSHGAETRFSMQLAASGAILAVCGALIVLLQRSGFIARLQRITDCLGATARWPGLAAQGARIDRSMRAIYGRRRRVLACFTWQLAGWMLGAGEIWLALHFLGHPATLADALILEAIVQAISSVSFLVPGALGVQEGGFLIIGAALGIDGPTSLALAAARRLRDLIVFFPGLLAWQLAESRSARNKAAGSVVGPAAR